MEGLINVKFNWKVFAGVAIFILFVFPDLSLYSYFAILITIHQGMLLFFSLGYVIPVRYLFGSLMALQVLFGPMLAYSGFDKFQLDYYQMKIPETLYFSYAIPAVISFILGLHILGGKLKGEVVKQESIVKFVKRIPFISYLFIIIGFFASLLSELFTSDLDFLFYLLGNFKFIGISNVNASQLASLCKSVQQKPSFVQNRCYAALGWDKEVREICRAHGIIYQGFSLLTANQGIFADPAIRAIAQRLGTGLAQVVFRFAMQVGMLPLTGTTNQQHMKEDLQAEQLTLTAEDMQVIETIGI